VVFQTCDRAPDYQGVAESGPPAPDRGEAMTIVLIILYYAIGVYCARHWHDALAIVCWPAGLALFLCEWVEGEESK